MPKNQSLGKEFFSRIRYLISEFGSGRHVLDPFPTPWATYSEIGAWLPTEPFLLVDKGFEAACSSDRFFFTDTTPRDVGWFDISAATLGKDEEVSTCIVRVRRVGLDEVRGYRITSPHITRLDVALIYHDGRLRTFRELLSWAGNGLWLPVPVAGWSNAADESSHTEIRQVVNMALGVAFTRRYDWRVTVGLNRPVLSFPTDPAGVLAAFRARDKPEGKGRRDPLRHWVERHWRRNSSEGTETAEGTETEVSKTEVREHLRGGIKFNMGGYSWEITPSEFDLERASKAKSLAMQRRRKR